MNSTNIKGIIGTGIALIGIFGLAHTFSSHSDNYTGTYSTPTYTPPAVEQPNIFLTPKQSVSLQPEPTVTQGTQGASTVPYLDTHISVTYIAPNVTVTIPTYTHTTPYQATPPVVTGQPSGSNNCIGASNVGC